MLLHRSLKLVVRGAAAVLAVVAAAFGWLYWPSFDAAHPHLNVKPEGAVNDRNFRDAGASFNACLGQKLMREDRVFRAAVWFSGWSCAGVGNPDEVFTLNFDPEDGREYYCRAPDGIKVGRHYNDATELSDLEFLPTWSNAAQRDGFCGLLRASYADVAAGKRILVHCDAGRDRTGTYNALLQALVAESRGALDERVVQAIECDYRRSETLAPAKYGRMAALIAGIRAQSTVAGFLSDQCKIPPEVVAATASALFWPAGQPIQK